MLWTAEEQGGVGAQQYYNLHKVLSTVTAVFAETQCISSKAKVFLSAEAGKVKSHSESMKCRSVEICFE